VKGSTWKYFVHRIYQLEWRWAKRTAHLEVLGEMTKKIKILTAKPINIA
jgi:hypothetical protein